MRTRYQLSICEALAAVAAIMVTGCATAPAPQKYKMTTPMPPGVASPDR